jgi:SET domain-containing protein
MAALLHYKFESEDTKWYEREALKVMGQINTQAVKTKKPEEPLEKADDAFEFFNLVRTHARSMILPHGIRPAYAFDFLTAIINHNCEPNAIVVSERRLFRVRSLKKISAGDEITICYTNFNADKPVRMKDIFGSHRFNCNCTKLLSCPHGEI